MSIYKKAAKKLVKSDNDVNYKYRFACNAIESVGGSALDIEAISSYFRPKQHVLGWYYSAHEDGAPDSEFNSNTELGNLGRSLMLLFMHEIYIDELKKKQGPKKGAAA